MFSILELGNIGSFLGGIASTIGLVGLVGLWFHWNEKVDSKRQADIDLVRAQTERIEKEKIQRELQVRNEEVQQQNNILVLAHSSYATMVTERNKLYVQGMSSSAENIEKHNFAILAASELNLVFMAQLTSWLRVLSKLGHLHVDIETLEILVGFTRVIDKQDRSLVLYFAAEEVDIELKMADGPNDPNEVIDRLRVSSAFQLSPQNRINASKTSLSALEGAWLAFKEAQK